MFADVPCDVLTHIREILLAALNIVINKVIKKPELFMPPPMTTDQTQSASKTITYKLQSL